MILRLAELPSNLKGPDDSSYKGMVPKRARFLAPDAAQGLLRLEKDTGGYVYTDIFRSADSSLAARRVKRGVQRPGYSPHNYGFAVDLDVYPILKKYGIHYGELLEVMKAHGWYCHRRDGLGPEEMEAWHFNYLGPDADKYLANVDIDRPVSWSNAAEARILERYASSFHLTTVEIQTALKDLKIYGGEADGDPNSHLYREAVMVFQRAWDLEVDGDPGTVTQRTLALVTARQDVVTAPTNLV